MIKLPFTDPGNPDTRSPLRFLLSVARPEWNSLSGVITLGLIWLVSGADARGRPGDPTGHVDSDNQALLQWSLILFASARRAAAGVMRPFRCVELLQASFRMAQIVAHHAARTGPAIKKGHSTGEVVATVSNDAMRAGGAFDITARLAGAFVSYIVVAIILLSSSVPLRLVVLLGMPVLSLPMAFLLQPLQKRPIV
jgi:ABC-type multidrug transport system fused ATPase/permease subunit